MEHQTCFNELCSEVLGDICARIELSSVVKLFKVGNRILTAKMGSVSGIRHYQDRKEFISSWNHFWLLPQLQGLDTVSLSRSDLPSSTVNRKLLDLLPKTVTSLSLSGYKVCKSCFGKNAQPDTNFDYASRFPQLFAFSMRKYHEKRLKSVSLPEEYFRSFPVTLRQLTLDLTHFKNPVLDEVEFPINLEYLDFLVNDFQITWILSLRCTRLHTLKVRSKEISASSFDDSSEATNLAMKTLHLWFDWPYSSVRSAEIAPYELEYILSNLPSLEEFQTHYSEDTKEGESMFTKHQTQLRTLVCGFSRPPSYGATLTKLELARDIEDECTDELEDDVLAKLPSLLEFYDPSLNLKAHQYDLLPRTLTALVLCWIDVDSIKSLPPLLTRVGTINSTKVDYDFESEEFCLLLNSLPFLKIADVDDLTMTLDLESGWTYGHRNVHKRVKYIR